MDERLKSGGPIIYVLDSKPYRAVATKWWTHCGTDQPACNLYWFSETEGAAPIPATSVPHRDQVGGRGNYWVWWNEGTTANLEPGPVPTSTPSGGSPPP